MFYIHFISSGERVYDIAFWKSELNNEVNAMATEIENLKVTGNQLKSHKKVNLNETNPYYYCHGKTVHHQFLVSL